MQTKGYRRCWQAWQYLASTSCGSSSTDLFDLFLRFTCLHLRFFGVVLISSLRLATLELLLSWSDVEVMDEHDEEKQLLETCSLLLSSSMVLSLNCSRRALSNYINLGLITL